MTDELPTRRRYDPLVIATADLEAHRRELLTFCYRMLGSVYDAEDAVQETMIRAWRASDRYDAALRLGAHVAAPHRHQRLPDRGGRTVGGGPCPADLGAPSDDPTALPVPSDEIAWLQPLPDSPEDTAVAAATACASRSSRRCNACPPAERAALILRETLDSTAEEIADALDTTPAAVNSALQRARATLAGASGEPSLDPDDPVARRFVEAYAAAVERADVAAIRAFVTADVVLEMPPVPAWFVGSADFARFMDATLTRRTGWRMIATRANGQPALIAYAGTDAGTIGPHSYQVLDVGAGGIRRTTVFYDQALMAHFGVPQNSELR